MDSPEFLHSVPPKGVWVPVPTFFKKNVNDDFLVQPPLDLEAQGTHALFLAKSGITGLVLLGSTGEAIHLSRSERAALVASVRSFLSENGYPNYPIMAGVLTSGGMEDTEQWISDMAEAGAQWALVLVPGYFGTASTQSDLVKWYKVVASRSPIPILVYNYPGVTNGVVVLPETYMELAAEKNIVGCKMSHGNVSHHVQVSLDPDINHDEFRVFSGFGQQLGPIVAFGAAGVIDGMAAFFPRTVVRLFDLMTGLQGGNLDEFSKAEVLRLQYIVSRAEEFVVRHGLVGIKEAVYRVTGISSVRGLGCRLPITGSLSDEVWEEASRLFLSGIEAEELRIKLATVSTA